MLLRFGDEGAQGLAQGGEPLAVVNQLRKGDGQALLFVHGHLVQADAFQVFVGLVEDGAARGLVDAAALHADQTVFHDVQQADAVLPAQLVELQDDLLGGEGFAVQLDGYALLKVQGDVGRFVRGLQGGNAHLQEAGLFVLGLVAGVLQVEALVAQVPEVLVLGVVGFPADLEGHVMRLGVVDLLVPGLDGPFPPGSDHGHVRQEVLDGQLEADLVVALAGAAVADGVRVFLLRDLRQALGDAGTGVAGAQEVVFIDGSGLHGGDDVFVDVFVRQVQHVELGRAGLEGLFLQAFQLVRLADVAGHGDDFRIVVVFLEPGDDDGSIQSAGIGQDDFLILGMVRGAHASFLRSVLGTVCIIKRSSAFVNWKMNKNTNNF